MDRILTQTLTEIEGRDWGDPVIDSHLMTTVHSLRHKPIGGFTVEDLRIAIGQSVGLPHLVPLAITKLESDPLLEGDLYPGDLLCNVLRIGEKFWTNHPALRDQLIDIAKATQNVTDDTDLRSLCSSFVSRWTQ